jgi:hypothetical protein
MMGYDKTVSGISDAVAPRAAMSIYYDRAKVVACVENKALNCSHDKQAGSH